MTKATTLTLSGSPYNVSCDLIINSGQRLHIESGVELRFQTMKQVRVFGVLDARGTAAAPIRLISAADTPAAGDWKGLYFAPTSIGSQLRYAEVRHAGAPYGLSGHSDPAVSPASCATNQTWSSIYADSSAIEISDTMVTNGLGTGINMYQAPVRISSTTIQAMSSGTRAFAPCTGAWSYYGYGIYSSTASPAIEASTISGNSAAGISVVGGRPLLRQLVLQTNSGAAIQLVNADLDGGSGDLRATGNTINGATVSSTMVANSTWPKIDLPYVITRLIINSGVTLTLPAGQVFKFPLNAGITESPRIVVHGRLVAQGSVAPIVFTSLRDDSVGGDTNNDAAASTPAPGDWSGIFFGSSGLTSQLDSVDVRYSGDTARIAHPDPAGTVSCGNFQTWSGLYVDGGRLEVSHSTIRDGLGVGVNLYRGSLTLDSTSIQGMQTGIDPLSPFCSGYYYGYGIYAGTTAVLTATNNLIDMNESSGMYAVGAQAQVISNTLRSNTTYGLMLTGGTRSTIAENTILATSGYPIFLSESDLAGLGQNTVAGNTVNGVGVVATVAVSTTWPKIDLPYVITRLTVTSGVTLTLPAGQVVKFPLNAGISESARIVANGTLVAEGTAAAPIVFTSLRDDSVGGDTNNDAAASTPAAGDWSGMFFAASSLANQLEHVEIRYGGESSRIAHTDPMMGINCGYTQTWSSIYLDGGALAVRNSVISDGLGLGVNAYAGQLTLDSTLIQGMRTGVDPIGASCNGYYNGYGIYASATTSITVTSNIVANNQRYGIYATGGQAQIVGNTLRSNTTYGLMLTSGTRSTIAENTILATSGYPIFLSESGLAGLGQNTVAGNTVNGVGVVATVAVSTTWPKIDLPYVITRLTVTSGVTLTLPAGQVVKFPRTHEFSQPGEIVVNGTLVAEGTAAAPIVFTSLRDDSVGGDTNNDAAASTPAPGDWAGIYLASGVGNSFAHVDLRYAGASSRIPHTDPTMSIGCGYTQTWSSIYLNNASLRVRESVLRDGLGVGLNAYQGSLTVENSLIRGMRSGTDFCNSTYRGYGLYSQITPGLAVRESTFEANQQNAIHIASGGSPLLAATTFRNNQGYAVFLQGMPLAPGSGDNSAAGNTVNGIGISQFIVADTSWPYSAVPYVVQRLSIGGGTTLTVPAGQVIKVPAITTPIEVHGRLVAAGSAEQPIVLTSIKDDTVGGDTESNGGASVPIAGNWVGLYFGPTSSNSLLRHLEVRYAGATMSIPHTDPAGVGFCGSSTTWSSIYIDQSALVLEESAVLAGLGVGVNVYQGSATLHGTRVAGMLPGTIIANCTARYFGYGIHSSASTLRVTDSTITDNMVGIYVRTPQVTAISGNILADNAQYGVYANSTTTIDAPNNWWGSDSGPAPYGAGNGVNFSTRTDDACNCTVLDRMLVNPVPWTGNTATYGLSVPWQQYEGDPVNTATGNYSYAHEDLSIPTRATPLAFQRSYNSAAPVDGPLGYGWTHGYAMAITSSAPDGSVSVSYGDGRTLRFTWNGQSFVAPAGSFATLARAGGGYTLSEKDRTIFRFASDGRLSQIENRNGHTTALSYASGRLHAITEPGGRALILSYDGGGRLSQVTDPLSRSVSFHYAATGDLIEVIDVRGATTSYVYDAQHRMTAITDPNGHTFLQTWYDINGRAIEQHDADGALTRFRYDILARTTTVTDPRGARKTFTYDASGRLIREQSPVGGLKTFTWDATNSMTSLTDAHGAMTTFTYDARGNLLGDLNALGGRTLRTYDGQDNLLSETDALSRTVRYSYDAWGNRTSRTDSAGALTRWSYFQDAPRRGLMASETDALSRTTTFDYDQFGNLAQVTDALGAPTRMRYDLGGRLVEKTNALSETSAFAYDAAGHTVLTVSPLGAETRQHYDAVGNLIETIDPLGGTTTLRYTPNDQVAVITDTAGYPTSYSYDQVGNMVAMTDGNGTTTRYGYDAASRLISTTNPLSATTRFTYDLNDNQLSVTDPLGHTTTTAYDRLNRPIRTRTALGHESQRAYDLVGNTVTVTDTLGAATQYRYDRLNRLIEVQDSLGGIFRYSYDDVGNRLAQTDPLGHTTRMSYDALNRVASERDARDQVTRYYYDAAGRLLEKIDANGQSIHYAYDAAGQPVRRESATGTVQWSYDAAGNRTQMVDSTGVTTTTYDALYRPTMIVQPAGTVQYRYDAQNRVALILPDGKRIQYGYDGASQLVAVTDWLSQTTSYRYDLAGRPIETHLPNTLKTVRGYDADDRLIALQTTSPISGTVLDIAYTLDARGAVLTQRDSAGDISYTYDRVGRLTSASYANGAPSAISYTYDAAGNRIREVRDGLERRYLYDAADQLYATVSGNLTTTLTWDARGQVLSDGARGFDWDVEGRLVAVTGPVTATFGYNGDGARVWSASGQGTTRYLQDLASALPQVLEERGADTITYLQGQNLIGYYAERGAVYLHADGLGSVRASSTGPEAFALSASYDAFGQPRAGVQPTSFGYAGEQEHRDLGLVFLRARYYDPGTGRFLSRDPWPATLTNPLTAHRYTYAHNQPTFMIDPSGMTAKDSLGGTGDSASAASRYQEYRRQKARLDGVDGYIKALTEFHQLISTSQDYAKAIYEWWQGEPPPGISDALDATIKSTKWILNFVDMGVSGYSYQLDLQNDVQHGRFSADQAQTLLVAKLFGKTVAIVGSVSQTVMGVDVTMGMGAHISGDQFMGQLETIAAGTKRRQDSYDSVMEELDKINQR